MLQTKSKVEGTFKSKDTEEYLDVIFYRPLGYRIALAAKFMRLTPNSVTIASIILGIVAGRLFFYDNYYVNLLGIFLMIASEAFDSADGQLARLTNNFSRYGRILDGFGSNLTFLSIYIHICLRMMNHGVSPLIFVVAVIAGLSHSCQSAIGDYGRNFYTYFVYGKEKSELDDSGKLKAEYPLLKWSKNFWKKLLMRVYVNYTVQQEALGGSLLKVYRTCLNLFPGGAPANISELYRRDFKSMIKYYNILTTNTRMMVLVIALLINYLPLYFIFELTVMNLLLVWVVTEHSKKAAALNKLITVK